MKPRAWGVTLTSDVLSAREVFGATFAPTGRAGLMWPKTREVCAA